MKKQPSNQSKLVAQYFAGALGGKPTVREYWDDKHISNVYVLTCSDIPQVGLRTYTTVSLSECPLTYEGKALDLRAEIIGVAPAKISDFDNCIATAAFYAINSGYELFPGAILPEVLKINGVSNSLKHFYCMTPFLWPNLTQFTIESTVVASLLVVPISDQEMAYAVEKGGDALEALFER